ncbi:MAG: hypothetical protein H0W61_17160 [Bacteroidetes bacterium]|nr:hypothetical protein [Bacteroidota bacterium]
MKKLITILISFTLVFACKNKSNKEETPEPAPPVSPVVTPVVTPTAPDINTTYGFSVLKKLRGIWNGPVTSTTPLGGYPEWIVDFRPISENQISAKNELDTLNDIHLSFFIALYNNQYKVAFRNGGSFGGQKRVSYFLADSVSDLGTSSFYRFAEIIKGKKRAYTEVIFKADSLYIRSYTNKYNTQTTATPHMVWSAKLQDSTSCQPAVSNFSFPKKTLKKDFSTTFSGQAEAIYYSLSTDPFPENAQPYLGITNAAYSYAAGYTPAASKKAVLIITTQPLFSGPVFLSANLKYRSRYVILAANDANFNFNYMHPGTYYYYAWYDADGNAAPTSGDWISTSNITFTLGSQGTASTTTQINFTIP